MKKASRKQQKPRHQSRGFPLNAPTPKKYLWVRPLARIAPLIALGRHFYCKIENMKALKPFKTNSWGIFYRVNRASDINKQLIDSLEWPENICLGISFKPMPLTALLKNKLRLPPEYRAAICCYSRGRGLRKTYPAAPSFGIETRPPHNFKELKRLQISMAYAFARSKKGGLNKQFKKSLKGYLDQSLAKTKSLIVTRNAHSEGLFSLLPSVGGNVTPVKYDGITWHQFPGKMTANQKKSAYHQVSKWLKETAKLQVAVKFSPGNIALIKFLSGMDFIVSSVQFTHNLDKKP